MVQGTPLHWLLSLTPLVYLGRISYSIYLLHLPVSVALASAGLPALFYAPPLHGFLKVAATIGVSALAYRLIEIPGQRLGAALDRRLSDETHDGSAGRSARLSLVRQ
jgi:peptidoglycan/LPS O-acetylase OafA/YrhL